MATKKTNGSRKTNGKKTLQVEGLTIRTDIPLPPKAAGPGREPGPFVRALAAMPAGAAMVLDVDGPGAQATVTGPEPVRGAQARTLLSRAYVHGKKTGAKFVSRRLDDNRIGIWRVS